MQYEKQVFTNGQVLTAECLNRMEEGIKGACEAIPPTCDSTDCSKVLSYGPNGFEWIDKPTGGGGSGAGLPTVTDEDNGKFLQAMGGVWMAVDAIPQVNALIANYVNAVFVPMTQEEYDALGSVDPNKYYMIVG